MQELLAFFEAAIGKLPGCLGTVQHHCSTQDIGLYEDLRVADTSVYMAFGCEMYHAVNIVLRENFADGFLVADIRLHESVIVAFLHILEVLQITRISQGIHVNDADLIVIFFEHVMNVVGTDKAGTACHQISSHFFSVLRKERIFAIDRDILP